MIAKRITIFLITIFFICLYILFLFFFQIPEMTKAQNNDAKKIIKSIYFDIKEKDIKYSTLKSIPNNLFFALWVKNNNQKWLPIVYDSKLLTKKLLYNPNTIPNSISITTRIFKDKLYNYQFVLWLNKFNTNYIMKHIVLSLLFLILIYLILLLLIEIFLRKNSILIDNEEFENNDEKSDYIKYDAPTVKEKYSSIDENKIKENLNEYKKMWEKNFNISDDFKNNFPFKKIYELIKIGINPEKYIMESIEIASNFFKWENPKFYLSQKNYFVDIQTKQVLDENNIIIPLNGKQKGPFFIPLYPYNIGKNYGYLYFEWNNKKDFYISDILFFLKYIFSERAKYIFLNSNLIDNITEYLKDKLESKDEVFSAIINVDNKDKIILESEHDYIEKLNSLINNKLLSSFFNEKIFQISKLSFILIGNTDDKNEKIKELETWIKDIENQYYSLSNELGNIAVTFSIGISFKNNRNLHPLALLNESENNLNSSLEKGGNTIVSN